MNNQKNNENILKLLLLMAFADKVYMEEEKDLIIDVSKKLNIPNKRVDSIINVRILLYHRRKVRRLYLHIHT